MNINQMSRDETKTRVAEVYIIEDREIIDLCIKRLEINQDELAEILARFVKSYKDYLARYNISVMMKLPIKLLSRLNFMPGVTYFKYFG
jgi:hypothetical protein